MKNILKTTALIGVSACSLILLGCEEVTEYRTFYTPPPIVTVTPNYSDNTSGASYGPAPSRRSEVHYVVPPAPRPNTSGASYGPPTPPPNTSGASYGPPTPPPNTSGASYGPPTPPPNTSSASYGPPTPPPSNTSGASYGAPKIAAAMPKVTVGSSSGASYGK